MLIFFFLTPHPFFSSLLLLGISLSILFFLNRFSNWINFIICLIYLGGVLILFVYISSITPNKLNYISKFIFFLVFLFVIFKIIKKNFLIINLVKILFYSPLFFKFWIIFLFLILFSLFLIRDFCKINFSSFRII